MPKNSGKQQPKIISMMMAPSVFLQEKTSKSCRRKKALANAYAYFRENNYLLENPEWKRTLF
jgi:hypothetical protein